jgi:UDP-N-acetylmuramyl pentapeptide phosphotransferase/UDP-N-acetylglucosamine-1-phosphate transferase
VIVMLLTFTVATTLTLLVVRSAALHGRHSGDRDFSKPQKVHVVPVPRIGGLGIVLAIAAGAASLWSTLGATAAVFGLTLLACAMPAFLAGFVQDFTEAITPRGRLVATATSAAIAFFWMDAGIRDTGIPGVDWLLQFAPVSFALTLFAVAGVANAVNIIDGLNGLASMCVMLMLGAIAYVAFQVGDPLIGLIALGACGAVLGFFVWNYPSGLIFLGDGGAYVLGFYVSVVSILLLNRNDEVSPLFPLLVCIYPVFETVFSIYRRMRQARPPHMPDGIHLHSLVYRRLIRWATGDRNSAALTRRNSMSSPLLWMLCMLSVVPAVLFWQNTLVLAIFIVVFTATYLGLYWRIVRFRAPRWLVFRKP